MRETEFRGKSINDGKWYYGKLFTHNMILFLSDDEIEKMSCFDMCSYVEDVYEETVGEYTGRKDKNGKKIFDGDIVKYHTEGYSFETDTIGVVEFCEGTFGIASNKKQHFLSFYNMSSYVRYIEVIGNLYDNPELLEMEK